MNQANPAPAARIDVICLCALWCYTCNDYVPRFRQIEKSFPQAKFTWLDIEDQADLVDPVEVENFPTLLIARGGQPVFFGPVLPHIETLERLVRQILTDPDARALSEPALLGLMARLQQSGRNGPAVQTAV